MSRKDICLDYAKKTTKKLANPEEFIYLSHTPLLL